MLKTNQENMTIEHIREKKLLVTSKVFFFSFENTLRLE